MLGRNRVLPCPRPARCTYCQEGNETRQFKRVEQRQVQREIVEQLDETDDRIWLPVRLPVS